MFSLKYGKIRKCNYNSVLFIISGKKDKGKKGGKDKDDGKKKKPEEEEDLGFKMGTSNFLADLMVANSEYEDIWKNKDERGNPRQNYYADMIREQNTNQVEAELRKVSIFY